MWEIGHWEQTKGETHRGVFVTQVSGNPRKLLAPDKPFLVAKCLIKGENT